MNQLFIIIGRQTVEIAQLRGQLAQAQQELAKLQPADKPDTQPDKPKVVQGRGKL